jgi:hypothetical protein
MFKVHAGSMPTKRFETFEAAEQYIKCIKQNYYLLNVYIETPSGAQIHF